MVTTPRIGDTVHYYPNFTDDQRCLAALVIDTDTNGTELNLAVWTRAGDTYTAYPDHDRSPTEVRNASGEIVIRQYTPGTWHHIH